MKFKVGDRVKILPTSEWYGDGDSNPENIEGSITEIDIDDDMLPIWVEWDNKQHNTYDEKDLELIKTATKMTTNQLMKDALKAQVDKLLKANNTVTTLELKVELRKTDPEFYWNQATVSQMMDELYQNGTLTYTDNGTYRTYSAAATITSSGAPTLVVTPTPGVQTISTKATKNPTTGVKKISRTKALDLIKNSKGHFFKVVFTKKKDGKERTLNAQYTKDLGVSPLGLVRVKEASLLKQFKKEGTLANIPSKSVIRSFNINNLKTLGIGGQTYKITN